MEYVSVQLFNNNIQYVSGAINAVNDTIERIVPNGKTAYILEAKIVPTGHINLGSLTDPLEIKNQVEAQLKVDTAVKDKTNVGIQSYVRSDANATHSLGAGNLNTGIFNTLGLELDGDGAKKIEIENITDNGSAFASMLILEVTTGDTPAV